MRILLNERLILLHRKKIVVVWTAPNYSGRNLSMIVLLNWVFFTRGIGSQTAAIETRTNRCVHSDIMYVKLYHAFILRIAVHFEWTHPVRHTAAAKLYSVMCTCFIESAFIQRSVSASCLYIAHTVLHTWSWRVFTVALDSNQLCTFKSLCKLSVYYCIACFFVEGLRLIVSPCRGSKLTWTKQRSRACCWSSKFYRVTTTMAAVSASRRHRSCTRPRRHSALEEFVRQRSVLTTSLMLLYATWIR